jgi:hypothetical protein
MSGRFCATYSVDPRDIRQLSIDEVTSLLCTRRSQAWRSRIHVRLRLTEYRSIPSSRFRQRCHQRFSENEPLLGAVTTVASADISFGKVRQFFPKRQFWHLILN